MHMQFNDFLQQLDKALEQSEFSAEANVLLPQVLYCPTATQAKKQQILIGLGYWGTQSEPVVHSGICLNHKHMGNRFPDARRYNSVLELVLSPPEELQAQWWGAANGESIDDFLKAYILVVEDISPDSCLAWLCWLAQRMGVQNDAAFSAAFQSWLEIVNHWKLFGTASNPHAHWPSLHSALVHGYIGELTPGKVNPDDNLPSSFVSAWHDALRFIVRLMKENIDPKQVPDLRPLPAYQRAVAFLKAEYQDYRQSLSQAMRLQLTVPLSGGLRRVLVDAYFAVEAWPSGAKKVFIRSDREHTFLGEGHALMGLYRPNAGIEGSGNEITISTNPEMGIFLKDLWLELERMENERWGDERPNANPRRLKTYSDKNYHGGQYTQPWYDDEGRYTLLGVPKRLPDGRLGSKLNWNDVLDAVWRCYRPTRDIQVRDWASKQPCCIEKCPIEDILVYKCEDGSPLVKHMAAVSWMHEIAHIQSMLLSPTEKRVLGALVAHHEQLAELRLEHLPAEKELDFLELNGGFAIIHENGVFLMDDWTMAELHMKDLQDEFRRVCSLLGEIKRIGAGLKGIVAELSANSDTTQENRSSTVILADLAALRVKLAKAKETQSPYSHRQDAREFRHRLENFWSIGEQTEELSKHIVEIEDAFRVSSALQSQSFLTVLTMIGLPLVFGNNIAKALLDLLLDKEKTVSVFFGEAMFFLLAYVLLGLLGYQILKAWQAFIAKCEARQRKVERSVDSTRTTPATKWLLWLVLVLAVVTAWGYTALLQGMQGIDRIGAAGATLAKMFMELIQL